MGLFDFFKNKENSEEDEVLKVIKNVTKRKKTRDDALDDFISSSSISTLGGDRIPGARGRFGLDVTNPIL